MLQINVIYACNIKYRNNLKNTNFINKGYLHYDLKSYNYNVKNDTYTINVMEELDPGGDLDYGVGDWEFGIRGTTLFSCGLSSSFSGLRSTISTVHHICIFYKIVVFYLYDNAFYNNSYYIILSDIKSKNFI